MSFKCSLVKFKSATIAALRTSCASSIRNKASSSSVGTRCPLTPVSCKILLMYQPLKLCVATSKAFKLQNVTAGNSLDSVLTFLTDTLVLNCKKLATVEYVTKFLNRNFDIFFSSILNYSNYHLQNMQ